MPFPIAENFVIRRYCCMAVYCLACLTCLLGCGRYSEVDKLVMQMHHDPAIELTPKQFELLVQAMHSGHLDDQQRARLVNASLRRNELVGDTGVATLFVVIWSLTGEYAEVIEGSLSAVNQQRANSLNLYAVIEQVRPGYPVSKIDVPSLLATSDDEAMLIAIITDLYRYEISSRYSDALREVGKRGDEVPRVVSFLNSDELKKLHTESD